MMKEPLLDVNVATFGHRGMLGIAISNVSALLASTSTSAPPDQILTNKIKNGSIKTSAPETNSTKYVFLYYTAIQPFLHNRSPIHLPYLCFPSFEFCSKDKI